MPQPFSKTARILAALIAALVFASVITQITINQEPGGSAIGAFGMMLRFFTIWTNVAAGIVMGWLAWRGSTDPRIIFALTTAIMIVASVYHILLAAEHQPVGADWWTNLMFHSIIPAGVTLWWLVFSDTSTTKWQSLPIVMVFPIVYSVFALIHGASTGFYAYFFLDLPALGWTQMLINMIGLSAFFVAVGAMLLGLRKVVRSVRG